MADMSKEHPSRGGLRYAGPENHKKPARDPSMNSMLIIGLSLLVLGMILRYAARKLEPIRAVSSSRPLGPESCPRSGRSCILAAARRFSRLEEEQ